MFINHIWKSIKLCLVILFVSSTPLPLMSLALLMCSIVQVEVARPPAFHLSRAAASLSTASPCHSSGFNSQPCIAQQLRMSMHTHTAKCMRTN